MKKSYPIPTQVRFRDPYFKMNYPDAPADKKGEFVGGIAFGEYVIDASDGWFYRLDSFNFEELEFEELTWQDITTAIIE